MPQFIIYRKVQMPERKETVEIKIGTGGRIFVPVERKRIKSIRLKVYTGGEVKISAPFNAALSDIAAFAGSKAGWIEKCLQKRSGAPSSPTGLEEPEFRRILTGALNRLYPIVETFGVRMPSVTVRSMKTRWGSCSVHRGSIRLNSHLRFAPPESIDYVVLHELAHFLYPNHSKDFYGFIERYMPDWKQRKELLKRIPMPE
jgi:predicted metal-dependent hydrolase